MNRWAEVKVTISKVYAVELSDSETLDNAIELVAGEEPDGVEFEGSVVADQRDIESVKRHADCKLPL